MTIAGLEPVGVVGVLMQAECTGRACETEGQKQCNAKLSYGVTINAFALQTIE